MSSHANCALYGFDQAQRTARLELLGLGSEDHADAAALQERIIRPSSEAIVKRFYETLKLDSGFWQIIHKGYSLERLHDVQDEYVRTLGVDFDTAGYFNARLRVGAAHARVGVPLGLYTCGFHAMGAATTERIPNEPESTRLRTFLFKITMLDMSLATETYHLADMHRRSSRPP